MISCILLGMSRRVLPVKLIALGAVLLVAMGLVAGYGVGYDRIARKLGFISSVAVAEWSHGEDVFPDVDITALSATQQKIVTISKQEFEAQSPGVKFSEGASEAWCANFVSWVMKEAGAPLENPHTGQWRIPGTFTLQEYYEKIGRFRSVGSDYVPQIGDVAMYRGSPVFGDHANIVLKNDNGVLTTVGGNESNRIRVYENRQRQYDGLLGYGMVAK